VEQVRDARGGLVGPAVPLGQLDGRHAVLLQPCERPVALGRRLVGQAGELQKRPSDPVRQYPALFQVPLGLRRPGRPVLGNAEADQRQRAQLLAEAGLRRLRRLREGPQPLRLLSRRLGVAALAGQQQPDDPGQ